MAKDQAPSATAKGRAGRNVGRGSKGKAPARPSAQPPLDGDATARKANFNPIQWIAGLPKFAQEVRAEARKTTWTSPKETWITSVMVFIMVVVATLFFFGVDWGVSSIVQMILKIGA